MMCCLIAIIVTWPILKEERKEVQMMKKRSHQSIVEDGIIPETKDRSLKYDALLASMKVY